jgi:PAS domain S-box-containing protein
MTQAKYKRLMLQGDDAVVEEYFSRSSSELFAIFNASGSFNQVNAAWERVLGYLPIEIIGREFLTFVHPDDVPRTLEAFEQANASGALVSSFTNRYRHRDGSYRWLEWIGRRVPERGVHYSAARDVTAEMEARNQRRKASGQARANVAALASNR